MPRTIVIGDLHGCRREIEDLLETVAFAEGDRVVMVGDVVVRGPDPKGALAVLRKVRALGVRGNHEEKLLKWFAVRGTKHEPPLSEMTKQTARALGDEDFELLKTFPLWLDLPENGVRVVHAGLVPGVPMEEQTPATLMTIRCLDRKNRASSERGGTSWATNYAGPPHVVFGHNADSEPQIHAWATGLDTGCVYGGRLTAMVLKDGEKPPEIALRKSVLVSVKARKTYMKI